MTVDNVEKDFSSLNILTKLRPDIIKIDINLIRDIHKQRYS
ncbi:MAG: EAL domain-containing protein [Thermotoga sp.]|nr:EAL domain-containing protein [Thermotoga sp.]